MKKDLPLKLLLFTFTCTLLLLPGLIYAQQTTLTAGGDASGPGGKMSYSVGQALYSSEDGSTTSLAGGVQQPYEITVVTGSLEASVIMLGCFIHPNPTLDFVTLSIDDRKYEIKDLTYSLFQAEGKLLETQSISSNETQINMSKYIIATYYLKIKQGTKEIKTFKIIKM